MAHYPCVKSELDVFDGIPVQVNYESGRWVDVNPVTALSSSGPIEFQITSTDQEVIDSNNISLYVALKVKKQDGTNILAADNIAPRNNMFYNLFSDVEVFVNDRDISRGNRLQT